MNVTINGNIVTLHDLSEMDILMEIQKRNLTQYVALGTDLSFPMNRLDHTEFAGQIHRANNENKLSKKFDTKGGNPDKPDGTPPGKGGGAKVVELINTEVMAA